MDYRSLLASIPSGAERDLYIREAGSSEEGFTAFLELALNDPDPVAWRAAWIADGIDEQFPGSAADSIGKIIRRILQIKSIGALRSLLRLLCRYDIEKKDQGILVDFCFRTMLSELYPVAVKVHAMQIIYNHVLIYPELKEELATVIRDQFENNSAGFKSRGTLILQELEKM